MRLAEFLLSNTNIIFIILVKVVLQIYFKTIRTQI
jgi:hypothetical protein